MSETAITTQTLGPAPHIKIKDSRGRESYVSTKCMSDASPVFRSMIETCSTSDGTPELELPDPVLEHGYVLNIFLKVVVGGDVDQAILSEDVVWLARKYECSHILQRIELQIYRSTHIDMNPEIAEIQVAAALEAWPLCGYLISVLDNKSDYGRPLRRWLDPRKWSPASYNHMLRYGSLFLWGVTQSHLASRSSGGGVNYKKMGAVFREVMNYGQRNEHTTYLYSPTKSVADDSEED